MINNLIEKHGHLEVHLSERDDLPPVYADFCSPSFKYRLSKGGGRKQALARAIGLKHNAAPLVFDATAGLGRDSFVMAALGCQVIMCERSTIVHALLKDGLRRAAKDDDLKTISQRLSLYCGLSQDILKQICQRQAPDVIYIDPMFPHRLKSALVKKEMRVLRAVVGDDGDSDNLFKVVLHEIKRHTSNKHTRRLVCKRPVHAPVLGCLNPNFAIKTKKHRFDVYLV